MTQSPRSGLQPVDDAVRRMARALLGEARHAALACIDPDTGAPAASRVLMATDFGGDPVLLVSTLARHTAALLRDGRASLLIGDIAQGDPLSQPRMTLDGPALELARDDAAFAQIRRRFLARHPAASLYADFADFVWLRVSIRQASLIAGFARAYRLEREDLCRSGLPALIAAEGEIVARLNENHGVAITRILSSQGEGACEEAWQVLTLDAGGLEAANVDPRSPRRIRRIEFPSPARSEADIVAALARLMQPAEPTHDTPARQGL